MRLGGVVRVRPGGLACDGQLVLTGEPVRVRLLRRGHDRFLERVVRMVRTLAQGGAAGFTPLRAADPDDPWPWIAETLPPGVPLARRGRVLGPDEVVTLLRRTAELLGPLHAQGGVHLEVRPESFWSRSDAPAGLCGPSWEWLVLPPPALKATRDQPFAPPEGFGRDWSPAHDLYALGVCALQWLTGLPPEGLRQGRGFSWRAAVKDPGPLGAIIDRMIHPEAASRLASADDLLRALEVLERPQHSGPSGSADQGADRERRPWGAALALVPLLLRFWPVSGGGLWAWPGLKILVALGLLGGGGALAWQRLQGVPPEALPPPAHGDNPGVGLFDPPPWARLEGLRRRGERSPASSRRDVASESPEVGGAASGQRASSDRIGAELASSGALPSLEAKAPSGAFSLPATAEASGLEGTAARGGAAAASASFGRSDEAAMRPDGGGGRSVDPGGAGLPAHSPDKDPRTGRRAVAAPYDPVAEPGTNPEDASGLTPAAPWFVRVNKTYRTLTVYRNGSYLAQYPVTIGEGASTPEGRYLIRNKVQAPPFGKIPGGDARNPFGTHWLGLDVAYPGGKGIGLHGTNRPEEVGLGTSGGCIRLRNEDIAEIYPWLPEGTPVEIQ